MLETQEARRAGKPARTGGLAGYVVDFDARREQQQRAATNSPGATAADAVSLLRARAAANFFGVTAEAAARRR